MCVWGGPLGSTVWWLSHRSRARAPLLRTTLWDLSVAASLYFSLSHVRGCTRVPLKPSSRATRLWHQSVGRSPWSFRRPCVRILVLIQLWWVLNLFLRQSRDRSFNGVKPQLTACPGSSRTLEFLLHRFWWPNMKKDGQTFAARCPNYIQGKDPCQRPQGLLHPLPIPRRPCSHISLDFVTGLPSSQGNTVILVVLLFFASA